MAAHQAPRPWDSPGKNTGVGCYFLLQCMKVKVKSLIRVWLLATPWTAAYQAPPSMEISRQEYWSGVPLPPSNSSNKYSLKDSGYPAPYFMVWPPLTHPLQCFLSPLHMQYLFPFIPFSLSLYPYTTHPRKSPFKVTFSGPLKHRPSRMFWVCSPLPHCHHYHHHDSHHFVVVDVV